ncbi:hypothetical protein NLJ89_g8263 [Agrocybe chaxingu]|uniref:Uncharacterized protein n=1 Tax=Agrocybe chaxingu TaxID=84603 RepID=A0A9W8K239_9AGAR|nr:hypothetical protein NLJ89_g8263 [Agrocybe chaxingu]
MDHNQIGVPMPNFSPADRVLMSQPWMDKLIIVHPGLSREQIAAAYAAHHGSLEEAARAWTAAYKFFGTLPTAREEHVPPPWRGTRQIGRQPYPNESRSVAQVPLGGTHYGLRMWFGDTAQQGLCSLGFYNQLTGDAINTPSRYTIRADDCPPEHGSNILKSLEECYGVDLTRIRPGSQTYLVHQGMKISVYVDNERIAQGIDVPKYDPRA